jgi:transcriptional regulator with XRE-family HTH domain
MANESFGELVRKSRRASNKSLQEVADALQVTPVYVSEVERGKRPPFVTTRLPALAQVLNIDLTTLLRAAWAEKKMIDFDPSSSSKQIEALFALSRGGYSEAELDDILKIVMQKQKALF